MILLDVDVPTKEDVTCCFCDLQVAEPGALNAHESNCVVAQNCDESEKQMKIIKRDLRRLKSQHYQVFGRLMFNEKIPVKQRIRNIGCLTCDTFRDHLQGKCLILDKVTAFNMVTEKMRIKEIRIKSDYIELQFQQYLEHMKQRHELNEVSVCIKSAKKVAEMERQKVSPRTLRMAKRDQYHDLINASYKNQQRVKMFFKHRDELVEERRNAALESMSRRFENARRILRMTEQQHDPPQLRFMSTFPEPEFEE